MSSMKNIGILSKGNNIEWKINDFFSYTEIFYSPEFNVLSSIWQFEICPNGITNRDCLGYVSLFLYRVDNGPSKSIDFAFGIKTSKQLNIKKIRSTNWKTTTGQGWGWPKFIERAELEEDKENLVPSGNLTIVINFTLKDHEQHSDADERKNKLLTDLKDMFVSKKNTDVTIKVKEETFSAHSFILSARSPVLAAMFHNNMAEKETGFVNISDCDPAAFKQFLLYLYSGELDSAECDYFHLYKIADKYDVSELKQVCIDFILCNLSFENVCEIYMFGHQFNENEVLANVQNVFNDNFEKVISLDSWESFMTENACLANNLLKAMASKVKIEK